MRLTKHNGHYCDDCGYEPGEFCACNEEIAMYERLKQYEDAEEQDRLVEVRHGRWIVSVTNLHFDSKCSACGETFYSPLRGAYIIHHAKYCPSCGAKMDGG